MYQLPGSCVASSIPGTRKHPIQSRRLSRSTIDLPWENAIEELGLPFGIFNDSLVINVKGLANDRIAQNPPDDKVQEKLRIPFDRDAARNVAGFPPSLLSDPAPNVGPKEDLELQTLVRASVQIHTEECPQGVLLQILSLSEGYDSRIFGTLRPALLSVLPRSPRS